MTPVARITWSEANFDSMHDLVLVKHSEYFTRQDMEAQLEEKSHSLLPQIKVGNPFIHWMRHNLQYHKAKVYTAECIFNLASMTSSQREIRGILVNPLIMLPYSTFQPRNSGRQWSAPYTMLGRRRQTIRHERHPTGDWDRKTSCIRPYRKPNTNHQDLLYLAASQKWNALWLSRYWGMCNNFRVQQGN